MTTIPLSQRSEAFFKRFTPLFGAGVLGIAALSAANIGVITEQLSKVPSLRNLPIALQFTIASIQPTILLSIFVAAGTAIAPRLGLRSHIAEKFANGRPLWSGLKPELPLSIGVGVVTSVIIVTLDVLTRSLMPPMKVSGASLVQVVSHNNVPSVLAALLYGGITEELLLRWGVMSVFAWIGWKVVQRGEELPGSTIMWGAIVLSSLLFGLGHLPVTSQIVDLTAFVIVRALVLNGIFGIVAGWLYWRRSLEAAMIAHAMSHVVLTILNTTAMMKQ